MSLAGAVNSERLARAHLAHIGANKGSNKPFTTNKVIYGSYRALGRVCFACKSDIWWWRHTRNIRVDSEHIIDTGKGEWLCGRCHPKPKGVDS
jgi:hypothetical protein